MTEKSEYREDIEVANGSMVNYFSGENGLGKNFRLVCWLVAPL